MSPVQALPWELALPLRSSSSECTAARPWETLLLGFPVQQENNGICWIKLIMLRDVQHYSACEHMENWNTHEQIWTPLTNSTHIIGVLTSLNLPISALQLRLKTRKAVSLLLPVRLCSQWESELSSTLSWQLLFMSLSQRHTLSEGETPMLPDLLSTVKDPVWLEGEQRSGQLPHCTLSQQQSNLTLIILGKTSQLCLGKTSCISQIKHIPLSNRPLKLLAQNSAKNM